MLFFPLQKIELDNLWLKGPLILPQDILQYTDMELKSRGKKSPAQGHTGRLWNQHILLVFLLQKDFILKIQDSFTV